MKIKEIQPKPEITITIRKDNNGLTKYSAVYTTTGERIGVLEITDGVIDKLVIDDNHDLGLVASKLLTKVCTIADKTVGALTVPEDQMPTNIKRFLERYGFRSEKGIMLRKPGSIIPPSTIF